MNQGKDAANAICSTSLTKFVQISPKPELPIRPIIQVHERSIESDFPLIVLTFLRRNLSQSLMQFEDYI